MAEEAARNGVEAIAAVGTAGLRIAPNRAELIDAVRGASGVEVEVIPGEEEARLAYLADGSGSDVGDGPLVVFDTGGGSSQFTFGHGTHVDERFSVERRRRALHRAVRPRRGRRRRHADAGARRDRGRSRAAGRPARRPTRVVGMGGAVTNLTAVKHGLAAYDPDVVQGTVLDRAEIDRQIELYRTRDAEQRREIVGLQPKRAEVILAGACIVRTVLAKLGRESLTVSDRGLRHGLLVERFPHPT